MPEIPLEFDLLSTNYNNYKKIQAIKDFTKKHADTSPEQYQDDLTKREKKNPIIIMQETKQERQLLNHQRYLEMWDKHEEKVRKHFKQKEKEQSDV